MKSFLKVAAVVSSVVLAGGFIGYRAGAFNRSRESNARPADSRNDQELEELIRIIESTRQSAPKATQPGPTILPGSKSAPLFLVQPAPETPAPAPETPAPQQSDTGSQP